MKDTKEQLIDDELIEQVECMLTTVDNPFDPFDQFDQWLMFDIEKGYNTCSRIARIANYNDAMSEKESDDEFKRAIDEIIKYDFLNIFKKVTRETKTQPMNA